jgi:hypothetical protein
MTSRQTRTWSPPVVAVRSRRGSLADEFAANGAQVVVHLLFPGSPRRLRQVMQAVAGCYVVNAHTERAAFRLSRRRSRHLAEHLMHPLCRELKCT